MMSSRRAFPQSIDLAGSGVRNAGDTAHRMRVARLGIWPCQHSGLMEPTLSASPFESQQTDYAGKSTMQPWFNDGGFAGGDVAAEANGKRLSSAQSR